MFHLRLVWYCSYCAAQLLIRTSEQKQNITTERTPQSVVYGKIKTRMRDQKYFGFKPLTKVQILLPETRGIVLFYDGRANFFPKEFRAIFSQGPEPRNFATILYTVGCPLSRDVLFGFISEVLVTNRAAQYQPSGRWIMSVKNTNQNITIAWMPHSVAPSDLCQGYFWAFLSRRSIEGRFLRNGKNTIASRRDAESPIRISPKNNGVTVTKLPSPIEFIHGHLAPSSVCVHLDKQEMRVCTGWSIWSRNTVCWHQI